MRIEQFLLTLMILIMIGCIAAPFLKQTQVVQHITLWTLGLVLGLGICTYLFWKIPTQRLALLALFLIVLRIGFNGIILPVRYAKSDLVSKVLAAKELGEMSKEKELFVYSEPIRRYFHGEQVLNARTLFYITSGRGKPLQHSNQPQSGDWFIIEEGKPLSIPADTVFLLPSYSWIYPVMEIK